MQQIEAELTLVRQGAATAVKVGGFLIRCIFSSLISVQSGVQTAKRAWVRSSKGDEHAFMISPQLLGCSDDTTNPTKETLLILGTRHIETVELSQTQNWHSTRYLDLMSKSCSLRMTRPAVDITSHRSLKEAIENNCVKNGKGTQPGTE